MMTVREAVARLLARVGDDALVVSCNGMISREVWTHGDRPERFYMIGSMGLAASIGLGLALSCPDRRVVVLDGDGNVLMGLGALANVAAAAPRNLLHVVLDNGTYASTGDQSTISRRVALERVALAAGYVRAERVRLPGELDAAAAALAAHAGPSLLLVEVASGTSAGIGRVEAPPAEIARRFRAAADARAPVLLNPGPVNVSPAVRAAAVGTDLCHREPEYFALQGRVRAALCRCFALDPSRWAAVLIGGSGTAAVEAMVASAPRPRRKLLAIVNGAYGDRIAKMSRAHGIETVELAGPWTELPDLDALDRRLAADPAIDVVAVVHHETTTGLLNPVGEVARIAHRRGARVIVDAISSLAGEALPMDELGLDLVAGTANKCIEGLPGVSFVLARRAELALEAALPARSVYLHLPEHFARQERDDTAFTPPIPALRAFSVALDELGAEGLERRRLRMARAAERMRAGFARLGLEPLVPIERASHTITCLRLPPGVRYPALHDALRRAGFVVYAGQGELGRTHFRVANMGKLSDADIDRFLAALGAALSAMRGDRKEVAA